MTTSNWKEVQRVLEQAPVNESDVLISKSCLKGIWKELRHYHRKNGILGAQNDILFVNIQKAANLIMGWHKETYECQGQLKIQYEDDSDQFIITETIDNFTRVSKYSFQDVESKFQIEIIK